MIDTRIISVHRQLEMARTLEDVKKVRLRIKHEISVEEARRGYYKSCDILENIIGEKI